MKRLLVLAAVLVMLAPVSASAQHHPGHGHVFIGGGIGWGPYWGSYWGPYWGPYWGAGWWAPVYDRYANTGEIKLDTRVRDAQVFINGAYLGLAHDNKTIHLRPGAYKIEVREPGRQPYTESVYVTLGKTLHVHPEG